MLRKEKTACLNEKLSQHGMKFAISAFQQVGFTFLCIMIGKYFYLIEYKYFNFNVEQWDTNYQTFLFTASYVAIHNSTKGCTILVFGTCITLQWNYSRCTVGVIEAYCSHTGNLSHLWNAAFLLMKIHCPWGVTVQGGQQNLLLFAEPWC